MDSQLAEIYKQVLNNAIDKNAFKKDQMSWIEKRNMCKDVNCLTRMYVIRESYLSNNKSMPDSSIKNTSSNSDKIDTPCPDEKDVGDRICFHGILQDPCATGSGYGAMLCSKKIFERYEEELNGLYKNVLGKINPDYDENKPKSAFIEAQNKWILWRDSMCNYEHQANTGASLWQANAYNECLIKMTQTRSRAMKQYMSCFENMSEESCMLQHYINQKMFVI